MYLKITEKKYKGNIYRNASIVEGIRDGNKIRQKLIRNLGTLKTIQDEERAKELLDKYKKGDSLVSLNEINEKCFDYGISLIISQIWNELKLNDLFKSARKYDNNKIISLLISHRLQHYGSCNLSEREAHRWISEEAYNPDVEIELHQLYRAIRNLFSKKGLIEKHLFSKFSDEKAVIFYDLTSSYLEGEYRESDLAGFGYNRDKKKGKKQIVLGLLLKNNLPIAHKVWQGNTADKTTLKEAIRQAKSLGINNFIFVADRGIITDANIEFIEEEKLQYIIATQRRKGKLIRELMQKEMKSEVEKVFTDEKNKRAYYLCFNKNVSLVQINKLEEMKGSIEEKLSKLKKPTEHGIYSEIGKAAKYFKFKFKPFSFELNKEVFDYEKAIAGRYLLSTNNLYLPPEEIQKTYKQLAEIERAFGELKHLENMRPIFHKKDEAIKAHIFLCVLTLFFERFIAGKITDKTAREVFAEMKKLKVSKTGINYIRTDITKAQKKILDVLRIPEPPKIVK
jgi:transposase